MKNGLLAVIVSLFLFGCTKDGGDQFVGNWKKVSGNGPDFTIEKHDDMYLIKQKDPFIPGKERAYPAELKDGGLNMSYGIGTNRFVIDKTNGHLMQPGEELAKVTG